MRKKRQSEILKHISGEDKDLFLSDLLEAIAVSKKQGSFSAINECLDEWEATAELNSVPGLREKVWMRFNRLKDARLVHG